MRVPAVVGLTTLVLVLTGCGDTGPAPAPGASGETPAELVLPGDATLGLVGILTAANGATADLAVIVHASLPWMAPEAADAVAATLAWCAGEVDDAVISGRGFTFTQVDIRLTPRDDAWPDDATLAVLPKPNPAVGSTVAAGSGLRQVDASDPADGIPGPVPHCRQPAVLDHAGEGRLYLGIPQDIAGVDDLEPFSAWTLHDFGLSAHLPGELGAAEVTFSACASALSPLGEEFGAPNPTWADRFDAAGCAAGGSPAG